MSKVLIKQNTPEKVSLYPPPSLSHWNENWKTRNLSIISLKNGDAKTESFLGAQWKTKRCAHYVAVNEFDEFIAQFRSDQYGKFEQ